METDGVLTLFQRSLEKHNLVYNKFTGSGDSKSYVAVSSAQSFGLKVFMAKEECTSHITKRMCG